MLRPLGQISYKDFLQKELTDYRLQIRKPKIRNKNIAADQRDIKREKLIEGKKGVKLT